MILTENFLDWLGQVRIISKEEGVTYVKLWGTQRYLLRALQKGWDNGYRKFIFLKGRQTGITTILNLLHLYRLFTINGNFFGLVTHRRDLLTQIKKNFEYIIDKLPNEYKVPLKTKINEYTGEFWNGSRILLFCAGTTVKETADMGRGEGLLSALLSESAYYGDLHELMAFTKSFAEKNLLRLFTEESTANSHNHFYERWESAKNSTTVCREFIGWWRHDHYKILPTDRRFLVYWDGRLTPEEKEWVREIKEEYNYDIKDTQIAWFRWKFEEENNRDWDFHYQEYPPTPTLAFRTSGSHFFPSKVINDNIKKNKEEKVSPVYYQAIFGRSFSESAFEQVSYKEQSDLVVFEHPRESCRYIVACDPIMGNLDSDSPDNCCIQVFKIYADYLEQVAEFVSNSVNQHQTAWTIAFLAGIYNSADVIIELSGGGTAVLAELKRIMQLGGIENDGELRIKTKKWTAGIRQYLYRRIDSLSSTLAYHWYTTGGPTGTKIRMMNELKDYMVRGMIWIKSEDCLKEMRTVVKDGTQIAASRGCNDDRVITCALAVMCFVDRCLAKLLEMKYYYKSEEKEKEKIVNSDIMKIYVRDYLMNNGFKRVEANNILTSGYAVQ